MFAKKEKIVAIIAITIIALCLTLYVSYLEYLTLDFLNLNRELIKLQYDQHTALFLLTLFSLFMLTSCAPIPIASILTILCGALMGVSNGIIFESFATAISATITFFFSRYMFRLSIQKKYRERLELLLAKCEPVQI
jgi:uncharacterized membrane protein YdjX (TVP38/TMEM64 family)